MSVSIEQLENDIDWIELDHDPKIGMRVSATRVITRNNWIIKPRQAWPGGIIPSRENFTTSDTAGVVKHFYGAAKITRITKDRVFFDLI
jgi:hypothetical protein